MKDVLIGDESIRRLVSPYYLDRIDGIIKHIDIRFAHQELKAKFNRIAWDYINPSVFINICKCCVVVQHILSPLHQKAPISCSDPYISYNQKQRGLLLNATELLAFCSEAAAPTAMRIIHTQISNLTCQIR
jgi:hypothetical protein